MHPRALLVCSLSCLLVLPAALHASPANERLIAYSGTLVDDGEQAEGQYSMSFTLYGASESDVPLWSDQLVVDVGGGVFDVVLGETSPLPDAVYDDVTALWLEIEVEGDLLAGRQRIVTVPYATRAASVDALVDDLRITTSREPALVLDQSSAGGFTAQTFRLVGSDEGVSVVDVTGGGRRPFVVRAGAPTGSLTVAADGDVGLGVDPPQASLHVEGASGGTAVLVRESSGTTAARSLLVIENNGAVRLELNDTSAANGRWRVSSGSGTLRIDDVDDAAAELTLDASGNLTLLGTLTEGSDERLKTELEPIDDAASAIRSLRGWRYTQRSSGERRIGLVAQEVERVFPEAVVDGPHGFKAIDYSGLIAPLVEAVKELQRENERLAARVRALEEERR